MMVSMKRLVIVPLAALTLLLLNASIVLAQGPFYVRAGASGAQNGTNWTDAFTTLPASLVRGATYYVADGAYNGARTFNTPESGSQFITIRKATVSNHGTSAGWQDSFGDGSADFTGTWTMVTGYWDFDGVTGGGPGSSPADWPTSWETGHGFTLTVPQGANNVYLNTSGTRSNLNFRHIKMVNQTPMNYTGTPGQGSNVFFVDNSSAHTNNVLVEYIYVPANMTVPFHVKYANDWTIQYSYFEGNGIGNDSNFHRELWSGISNDRWIWRWNYIMNINNSAVWAFVNDGDPAQNTDIYGNIVDNDAFGIAGQSGGRMIDCDANTCTGWRFFNNTVTGWDDGCPCIVLLSGDSVVASNNLFANHPAHDYGVDWQATGGNNSFYKLFRAGQDVTASWANATGPNGQVLTSDPFVNYAARDLRLKAAIAVGTATNSPPGNAVDMFGNIRGGDGVWDRGALEFGGSSVTPPAPPTSVRIITN
jgi:hypothetical protein